MHTFVQIPTKAKHLILALVIPLLLPQLSVQGQNDSQISDNNQNITIEFVYTGSPERFHTYIDIDQDRSTGLRQSRGIGAEYLLEGEFLYYHPLNDEDWSSMEFIATVDFESGISVNGASTRVRWIVNKGLLGISCPQSNGLSANLVFETNNINGDAIAVSQIVSYTFNCTESTATPTRTILPTLNGTPEPLHEIRLAIPAYFLPEAAGCSVNCYWSDIQDSGSVTGIIVFNPNSGPGINPNPLYQNAIEALSVQGIDTIGYVRTSYGARELTDVLRDIEAYNSWYPVDGIFLDEVSSDCLQLDYYQDIYEYVKAQDEAALVVINPGTNTDECYTAVADTIVNFEDSFENYVTWTPSAWEANYPVTMFWHIVHTTDEFNLSNALTLARQRRAGWVYVTSDVENNPYDTLPEYWLSEISQLEDAN